jgi:hypothetical protein
MPTSKYRNDFLCYSGFSVTGNWRGWSDNRSANCDRHISSQDDPHADAKLPDLPCDLYWMGTVSVCLSTFLYALT